MDRHVELLLSKEDGALRLRSPEVGLFTCALVRGSLVAPGARAGRILALGETITLVVPPGAMGRIVVDRPERVHQPVGYGDVIYELEPIGDVAADEAASEEQEQASDLVLRAPYSGRFWHRPAPSDPPFLSPGDPLGAATTVGLIEVMKTFTHLAYGSSRALPASAEFVRYLVEDGAEVSEGSPLIEVRAAT
ncbi:MAG TPA: hypothetical protein ENJ09_10425 [Planctomycetes bacterium]|nr:hypothetical protein [Planctomycetota bacterium]